MSMESLPNIEQQLALPQAEESRIGLIQRLKKSIMPLALTVGLASGVGLAPERAEAADPTIVPVATTGHEFSGAENPKLDIGSDGKPIAVIKAFREVVAIHGGDMAFSGENVATRIASTDENSSVADVVVPPNENPIIFYGNVEHSSWRAICDDAACSTFENKGFSGEIDAVDADVAPDGSVGAVFSTKEGELLYFRYANPADDSPTVEERIDNRVNGDIALDYDSTGKAVITYRKSKDAMSAVLAEGQEPVITAIDTLNDAGKNISVINTPDGYRSAYQANEYDAEGNYVGPVTRVGSAATTDEQSGESGSVSSTVVSPDSGYDTALQVSPDGNSLVLLQGTELGLGIAQCVKADPSEPTPDCSSTSYQKVLDNVGRVNHLDYILDDNGSALAVYVTGEGDNAQLKAISGPDATFGIDLQAEGQAQQSSEQRTNSMSPQNGGDLPALPNPNNLRVSYDLRYVVGKTVVDACLAATNDEQNCDRIWHPTQP